MDIESLKSSLEGNPLDTDALEKLNAAYVDEANLGGLAELHDHIYDHVDASSSVDGLLRALDLKARTSKNEAVTGYLYARLGLLHWKKLDGADKAELYFRRVDASNEAFGASTPFAGAYEEFYTDFYARRGNWRRLEQFLTEAAGNPTSPDEIAALKRRLAQLAADSGSPEKAVTFWSAVLDAQPGDTEAEEALLDLYTQVKKWHSLIDLYQKRLERTADADTAAKIAVYLQMIAVYRDEIRSDTKVNATYQSILEIDPGNDMALDALEEQFEGMKRWPDLVRVLQQKIEHSTDPSRLVALHQRVAGIMMERFSNSAEALKSYHAILELQPGDREAIANLKDIYEKRRDYERYLEIARQEVELEADASKRSEQFLELARFATTNIRKPASAIGLWEEVLGLQPDLVEALEALESLYEREKDYEKLADTIDRRVRLLTDVKAQVALLEKLGLVLSSRLDDADRSVDVYRRILQVDASNRKAQNELRKHYLAAQDWDGLEWFFRQYGTISDLVRTLDAQAKTITDSAEQAQLLFKSADLALGDLEQPDRAIRSLEKVLDSDAASAEAARRLVPLYRDAKSWSKLADVLEIQLQVEQDAEVRRTLQLDLAKLYEENLSDPDQAFFAFVQVYKEDAQDETAQRQLERLAEQSGNWDTYAAVLEETLPRIEDAAARADAEFRAAEVYRDHIGDSRQALRHFQMAVAFDPTNRPAIDAIEALYEIDGEWRLLVELYKRKRELASNPAEEREILFKLGAVWRDRLANEDEATQVFQELLGRFPDDIRAHRELEALYLLTDDHDGLLDVLGRELGLLESDLTALPADVAELRCLVGQLTYAMNGDLHDVVHQYRSALEIDADSSAAVAGLESLVGAQEVQRQVTETLEGVYRARKDFGNLADIYEIQLRDDLPHGHKVAVMRMLGELYRESLGDEAKAFRTYARIFDADPGELGVREALELLASAQNSWAPLAELYERHIDGMNDVILQSEVRHKLASIYEEQLDDADNAQLHYEALLEAAPDHAAALDALERIYARTEQWEPLLGIFRGKLAAAAHAEARIGFLSRIEQVWSEQLGNIDEGIDAASEILVIDADNTYAWRRLEDLYGRAERWDDLAHALRQRIRLAGSSDDRFELMNRLADVQEHRLDDVASSIETRTETLAERPDHPESIAALERLFDARTSPVEVGRLLEPYYQRQDNWNRLIEVCEVLKEEEVDVAERVAIDFRIASLYEEKGNDPELAYLYYGSAYAASPESADAVSNILRLAEIIENHAETVALLEKHVEDIGDPDRRRQTHRIIAEVAEQKVGSYEKARHHYEAVLELDPGDMSALDALLALHRGQQAWPAVVETLQTKADQTADLPQKAALLKEAALLSATELDKSDEAIGIYEGVLALDPSDAEVLDSLEMLYEATSDWENLVRVLSRKADLASGDEVKALAFRRAEIFETRMDALDDAVGTIRRVLERRPDDVDALRRLDGLFAKKGDWLDAIENLKHLQPLTDEAEQLDIQFRLGQLWETELDDTFQAIDAYKALLDREPTDERALSSLEAIVLEKDERRRAFDVLAPTLELLDQWQRLLDLHEIMVEHSEEPEAKTALLRRMADIAEHRLAEPVAAFELYARAFRSDPARMDAAEQLERLAAEHGLWEELQGLYREGADALGDPLAAQGYRRRVGEILKVEIGDADRAVAVYENLLDDAPDDPAVLEALDELYTKQGAWKNLAGVLRSRSDMAAEAGTRIPLMFRLARTQFEKLDLAEDAFESYQEILGLDPSNQEAIDSIRLLGENGIRTIEAADLLEPIYREREAWTDLGAVIEMRLAETTDALDRTELFRSLADLYLNRLDAPAAAMKWLGEGFALDPEDGMVLGQLDELSQLTDEHLPFTQIVMRGADAADNDERRVELWHRVVLVQRERLQDAQAAESLLLRILQTEEDEPKALLALDEIYSEAERWDDLESILKRRVATAEYDDEQAKLWGRLAGLYRDKLDRWDDAVAAFQKLLALDESNEPSMRALAELHEARDEWADLYEVQRQLSVLLGDPAERVALFEKMATIAETRLSKNEEAIELWEEVLLIEPERRSALAELQRLLEAEGRGEALADTLRRELDLLSEDESDRKQELHLRLGRLWRATLEDGLQAQPHWEAVRAAAPDHLEALGVLRELYTETSAVEPLEGVLEDLVVRDGIEGVAGVQDAAPLALWRQLAELRQDVLGKPKGAIEAWEAVAELDASDEHALDQLERLYVDQNDWAAAARTLQRKISLYAESGRDEDAVDLALRVAEIQVSQLGQSEAAAETLRGLLARQPDHLDASAQLERIYEQAEDWPQLAELLLARLDHLEEPTERIFALHKLAKLHEERLEELEGAMLFHLRVLEEQPEDRHSIAELDRLAGITKMWSEFASAMQSAASRMEDPLLQVDTLYRLGVVVRDELDRPEPAVKHFQAVLELQPDHEATLRALSELHTLLEQWEPLIEVLEGLTDVAADYQERVRSAVRIGDVYRHQLGDSDKAVQAYRRVLDLDEQEILALEALDHLHTQREEWKELIDVLDLLARAKPDDEIELKLRAASVHSDKLGDAEQAIEVYESILDREPANEGALAALQALYGARNDWEGLVAVYERLLHSTEDDGERKSLHQKIALVSEEMFQDPIRASDSYREILAIDPMDREALWNLERIFEGQEQWEDLVHTLERHAEVITAESERIDVWMRMAAVYRDRMEDVDGAIRTYERILDSDPANDAALGALEALYGENGEWGRVIEVLDRKLDQATGDQRTMLRCRKAELYAEKLLNTEEASAELDRAIDEAPDSLLPVQALQRVYAATDNWEKVIDALLREEDLHFEPELKAAVLTRVASIYGDQLMDADAAVSNYERAMEHVPDFADAALPLSELYIRQEKWAKAEPLLQLMAEKVEGEEDPAKAAELYFLIGRSKQNLLEEAEALDYYARALDRVPNHLPTLRGIADLSFKRQRLQEAEGYYKRLVEEIADSGDTDELVACYKALGEIALSLNEDGRAAEYLDRVLELQPQNADAIGSLIELSREQENWAAVARYQAEMIDLKTDTLEKLSLQLEIGDIQQQKLGNRAAAAQAYRDALDISPTSKSALVKLLEMALQDQDHDESLGLLERLIEVEDEPAGRSNYALMLAVIYRDELKDEDRALEWMDKSLDHDPLKLEAFRAQDEILTRRKDWEAERRAYLREIERIQNKGQEQLEFKLYKALGEIYRTRLKSYDYAASAFELAAQRQPEDASTYEILAELYELAGEDVSKAIGAHRRLVQLEPDRRIGSYRALFRLYREAGDDDAAWCVAGVLSGLGQGEGEVGAFFDEYREAEMANVSRPVDGNLWARSLLADRNDLVLGETFQILYETLGGELRSKTLKDLELKKKDQLDVKDGTLFSNTLRTVVKALDLNEPKVYVSERLLGLRIENLAPPVLLVGKDMFTGRSEKELAFLLGKVMTYFLPIHVMAAIYSQAELKTLLLAALKVALPDFQMREDAATTSIAEELNQRLPEAQRERLASRLTKVRDGQINLANWINNVELTANHAGALLANDFGVSMGALRGQAFSSSKLPPKEKAKDLVLFAISDKYMRLRRELGLALPSSNLISAEPEPAS